jgi:hypothetical protein
VLELARGKLDDARRHVDGSLQLAGYGTRQSEPGLALPLLVAARVALANRAWSEAERFAREALLMSEAVARGPNTSADAGEALLWIARARISSRPGADMRATLQRAVQCLTSGLGPDHPLTREAQTLLTAGSGTS